MSLKNCLLRSPEKRDAMASKNGASSRGATGRKSTARQSRSAGGTPEAVNPLPAGEIAIPGRKANVLARGDRGGARRFVEQRFELEKSRHRPVVLELATEALDVRKERCPQQRPRFRHVNRRVPTLRRDARVGVIPLTRRSHRPRHGAWRRPNRTPSSGASCAPDRRLREYPALTSSSLCHACSDDA